MLDIKLSDFKVGQKCYVELNNNAKRGKNSEEIIEEWEVVSIGRKYITAKEVGTRYEVKFGLHNSSYDGLMQVTEYTPDYILYPNKKIIEEKFEKEDLIEYIKNCFSYYSSYKDKYSIEQLREIKRILDKEN